MAYEKLKEETWEANMGLVEAGLVVLTWGNASGIDRSAGVVAIKPSGVDYENLQPEDIVLVSLESGEVVEGTLRPSSDTATHLALYRAFDEVGGIIHTHSDFATTWAQACRAIPCLGTTHADQFHGPVPLTRSLTPDEIREDYEGNTGKVIVERFLRPESGQTVLEPLHVPAVLVPCHGPFAWGPTPGKALQCAITLEEVARMASQTLALNPTAGSIPREVLDKHFLRKHGPGAYYGQGKG